MKCSITEMALARKKQDFHNSSLEEYLKKYSETNNKNSCLLCFVNPETNKYNYYIRHYDFLNDYDLLDDYLKDSIEYQKLKNQTLKLTNLVNKMVVRNIANNYDLCEFNSKNELSNTIDDLERNCFSVSNNFEKLKLFCATFYNCAMNIIDEIISFNKRNGIFSWFNFKNLCFDYNYKFDYIKDFRFISYDLLYETQKLESLFSSNQQTCEFGSILFYDHKLPIFQFFAKDDFRLENLSNSHFCYLCPVKFEFKDKELNCILSKRILYTTDKESNTSIDELLQILSLKNFTIIEEHDGYILLEKTIKSLKFKVQIRECNNYANYLYFFDIFCE